VQNLSAITAGMPALFVVDNNAMTNFAISPFDSGAFIDGRYDGILLTNPNRRHQEFVDNYQLYADKDTPRKYVEYLYGQNLKYYDNKPNEPLDMRSCIESEGCYTLATQRASEKYDRRCSSIETRTLDAIPITNSVILWAIIPEDARALLDADLKLANIETHTYPPLGGLDSIDAYSAVIRMELRKILLDKGYM